MWSKKSNTETEPFLCPFPVSTSHLHFCPLKGQSFSHIFFFLHSSHCCVAFCYFLKYFFHEMPPAWLAGLEPDGIGCVRDKAAPASPHRGPCSSQMVTPGHLHHINLFSVFGSWPLCQLSVCLPVVEEIGDIPSLRSDPISGDMSQIFTAITNNLVKKV